MASNEEKMGQKEALNRIKKCMLLMFSIVGPMLWWTYQNVHRYITVPPMPNVVERLVFTLQCHTLTLLVLFNAFMFVANSRQVMAWNPLNPDTENKMKVRTNILTNTVEQTLLFVPATLILSTYLSGEGQMLAIPVLVIMFAIGRAVFAMGYLASPLYRGPGFFMTVSTNLLSLVLGSYHAWTSGSVVAYPVAAAVGTILFQAAYFNLAY